MTNSDSDSLSSMHSEALALELKSAQLSLKRAERSLAVTLALQLDSITAQLAAVNLAITEAVREPSTLRAMQSLLPREVAQLQRTVSYTQRLLLAETAPNLSSMPGLEKLYSATHIEIPEE